MLFGTFANLSDLLDNLSDVLADWDFIFSSYESEHQPGDQLHFLSPYN
jgi:hypothetical protein